MMGNHGDLGAFYDNGLGGLSLQAQTNVLRGMGLSLGDIPIERQFDPTRPIVIHNEGVDSFGHTQWDEYGDVGSRLTRRISAPVLSKAWSKDVVNLSVVSNGDQTYTQRIDFKNGSTLYRVLSEDGAALLTIHPGETLRSDPATGTYRVFDPSTSETRSYTG
ncbi:hypothetical protein [Hydrogenophaga sp.]|uniref:hypothetical protein n=1 Tax=Hydrogenophaga sp. TaxID=1904254 RepID=UPI002730814D|nr:hypothetical protein [Hydrogenophaga sp.]MDP1684222.1 hypothetical protein [Hydrogenophaga sp.]